MTELMTTIRSIAVHRKDENPLFGETVIEVVLEDEGGGAFIVLKSNMEGCSPGQIKLNYDELPKILECANILMNQESIKED